MSEKEINPNRRFIGKVKDQQGQFGKFQKVLIDNPSPTNQDGSANTYYKGNLIWLDAETGKKYLVKQIAIRGVSQAQLQKGFNSSLSIDLDSEYEVQDLG